MRLHLILDLPDLDPAQVDPHTLIDELLHPHLGSFVPGAPLLDEHPHPSFDPHIHTPEDFAHATFISAEWEES